MRLIDVYYRVKPAIPRTLQLYLRRIIASHKRKVNGAMWPIDPTASQKPKGWGGWPGGKEFAFILNHDVDSRIGLKKCMHLAELEMSLGFRSNFDFVPEDYDTPKELRSRLKESGFGIGVHGLKHDGKTFRSDRIFYKRARKINDYLREWKVVGFTSPSMLRNFRYMSELDIEWGCTTYDTDPFEPQSDGFGTIFPFIVGNNSGTRTYVELPYTLPQDHCLFVILQEKDIGIWKNKIDWIAANGGMALLNSHPDYMNFEGSPCSREEYPIRLYREFLEYVQTKYTGRYWHALPREVAHYWRSAKIANNAFVQRKLARENPDSISPFEVRRRPV